MADAREAERADRERLGAAVREGRYVVTGRVLAEALLRAAAGISRRAERCPLRREINARRRRREA